jgi:hypothetical protein
MKTRCPACGATTSLDALLGHSDASKAFVSALNVTGDWQQPLVKYLAMFRSESRDLTFERQLNSSVKLRLTSLLKKSNVVITHTQHQRSAWIWAINT